MPWLTAGILLGLLSAQPPPLCKGRVVPRYDPRLDAPPSRRAAAEVRAAYEALCPEENCGEGALYENPSLGANAVAFVTTVGRERRVKIVYSKAFLNALDARFGAGASFGVLAHEVGHQVTATQGLRHAGEHSWDEEMRADYLAGCALGRTGRSPAELKRALSALASVATASHPSFKLRQPAVERGYQDCAPQAEAFSRARGAFGLGAAQARDRAPARGCAYHYRLREDARRMGPVAAPRRQTRAYKSKAACERARAARAERLSEACRCE